MASRRDPSRSIVARLGRQAASLPLGVVLVTLVHLALLGAGVHFFDQLAGWFWPMRERILPHPELLLGLVPLPGLLLLAVRESRGAHGGVARRLCLIVLLGYAIQHGLGLLDGRGFAALGGRMLQSGHAEALRVAQGVRLRDVMTHFEGYATAGAFGRFARSKPPGFLLFYWATSRASGLFGSPSVERAASLATVIWPLFAYLTVVPLYALGRRALDERRALTACVLYVLVPSIDLIVLHTDEAFFPLIAVSVVWFMASSVDAGNQSRAVVAGVLAYLAAFCSFALLVAIPLAAVHVLGQHGPRRPALLGRMAAGFAAAYALFWLLFGYEPVTVAQSAFAFHEAWRPGLGGFAGRLYYAVLGAIELAVWIGLPVACAAAGEVLSALRGWLRARGSSSGPPNLMLGVVLVCLLLFGGIKAEAARLCCFVVPFVVLAAVERLSRLGPRFGAAAVTFAALEWATTLLTKLHQDFW